jgi:hypothetical protein
MLWVGGTSCAGARRNHSAADPIDFGGFSQTSPQVTVATCRCPLHSVLPLPPPGGYPIPSFGCAKSGPNPHAHTAGRPRAAPAPCPRMRGFARSGRIAPRIPPPCPRMRGFARSGRIAPRIPPPCPRMRGVRFIPISLGDCMVPLPPHAGGSRATICCPLRRLTPAPACGGGSRVAGVLRRASRPPCPCMRRFARSGRIAPRIPPPAPAFGGFLDGPNPRANPARPP